MKRKLKSLFFCVIFVVFIKGSISSPLDLFTHTFLSVETKGPIESATIQTTQVPQSNSVFEWQSRPDNVYNEQDKFYNESKIEPAMMDREEKEKTGRRPPLRNEEPDVHDSNSMEIVQEEIGSVETIFEKKYFHEEKKSSINDDFEDVIFNDSYEKLNKNKEFEMEGSGFSDEKIGITFEVEGSGDEFVNDKEIVKEKSKDLNRRKGKHGFAGIVIEKIETTTIKIEEEFESRKPLEVTDIITLSPITEDEWLKIINSSPKESNKYEDEVLDLLDDFLGLDVKTQPTISTPIKKNLIDIDPFEELTTISNQIERKNEESLIIKKIISGNGKFNSENISFIESEESITEKNELANIISVEDNLNETNFKENLEDYLLKLYPDLKQKALKSLTKDVKLETLARYDILKNIKFDETKEVITKTYDHTILKSQQIDDNVEICFVGTIGYQFVLVMENNEMESPKYLDEFNKICVNSYEPILIIRQESSFLELKFKILHDVITLQGIHVNVNGKDEIDNVFMENLDSFNALIGGNIEIDQLKLGGFNKNEEGLSLILFDVDLMTEMYLNGRLMADNFEDEEEGTTTLIISASVGVFSVSFLVILILVYQFCLKSKSRKMIYILTHR